MKGTTATDQDKAEEKDKKIKVKVKVFCKFITFRYKKFTNDKLF